MTDAASTTESVTQRARFGAVVLAAGGSTRMGKPKQLLAIEGVPLIVRAVRAALASEAWPIVVVLGCAHEAIRPLLSRLPLQLVENPRWADGIGGSISAGIDILDRFSGSLTGGLITLADQPHLSAEAINRLGTVFRNPEEIVAARYAGIVGAPVIFGRSYFPELLSLVPQAGAQRILAAHSERMVAVDLPECAIDLDTPGDYERFLEAEKRR